ncbi:MAG TPA: zinc ribbon domain-containing protein [Anaerolineae bacterium]|nr:zinc ribbon domain-containing protein [Anaerolineae bacterium]HQK13648.1 zinc ribbon domain-containing protein [Anaerolineae bacterium]
MADKVEQRLYHGKINAEDMARALVLRFDQGETRAQWVRGEGGRAVLQIQNRSVERGDPNTAVTVHITPTSTGVTVAVSEQQWLGVAADLAKTGVKGWLNPLRLLDELDDIARNVRWLGLRAEVWRAVDEYCRSQGSGRGTAAAFQTVLCPYCDTPNPIGAYICQACGGPLAEVQPTVCPNCGFLNEPEASLCVNCGTRIHLRR